MTKEIQTQINIKASKATIWNILMNFEEYPIWNPFIKTIQGPAIQGQKIKVFIQPPGAKGMTFKPQILVHRVNQKFTWLGHFIFPELFDGEHSFELVERADGSIDFMHSESFKGILVPLFANMLDNQTKHGFEQMNHALKERAERK